MGVASLGYSDIPLLVVIKKISKLTKCDTCGKFEIAPTGVIHVLGLTVLRMLPYHIHVSKFHEVRVCGQISITGDD